MTRRVSKAGTAPWELPKASSTVINAAALQDHLMRSMDLKLHAPVPSRRGRSAPQPALQSDLQQERLLSKTVGNTNPSIKTSETKAGLPTARSLLEHRRVWVCETCTFENEELQCTSRLSHHDVRCHACGILRPMKPRRHQITLAQQRGLVPAPPPKLSQDEWERCENQAVDRGDVDHPCSICRESFGVQEHVILSCSHMFHLACIQSFERFMRTNQRVCPLCRKENYQKRMTSKAAASHREKCATRIQAAWRGHLARKRTEALWHEFYRRGKGDPKRRRAFLANRIGKTTDRLVSAMRSKDDSIDSLLAEFDRTISLSKQVFHDAQPQTEEGDATIHCGGPDWTKIFLKAQVRGDTECPICIQPFSTSMTDVSLLTCSHVFHRECLVAFEDFNIYEVPLCPLCRAGYRSRSWSDAKKNV